jgi:thiol-disulfide isomerase/thioredoxin
MNIFRNSTKYAVVFVAGGIIFNATSAISNAPSTQDVLTDALAAAIGKVNDRTALRESQELAKLPNILECQSLKWLENCSTINEQAKKNPNAPLRVTNAKGLEFNFQPGTPSAVIRLQLEQTPEAARAAVKYMDDTWGEYEKSASLYQVASWQTKQNNLKSIDEAQEEMKAVKALDLKGLSLSVFVESTCNVCDRYLGILENLQKKYPQLSIRIFQLDQNEERFAAKVTSRGLRGRILSQDESNRLQ